MFTSLLEYDGAGVILFSCLMFPSLTAATFHDLATTPEVSWRDCWRLIWCQRSLQGEYRRCEGFLKRCISHFEIKVFFFFYLGLVRSPHVQRFDRVADGHIPVHTHHCQGEGAGEHVVVVDRHHCLAQSVPKWPEAEKHVCALRNIQKSENEHGNKAGGRTQNSISSEIWLWTVSYSMRWKQIRAAKHETITPDNQPVTDESPYNIQMLAESTWTTTVFQGTLLNVHSTKWGSMWIKNR